MRTFRCDDCGNTLFFENDSCLQCGSRVGFRVDSMTMATAASASAAGLTPCHNWTEWNACNWYVAAGGDAADYCVACSLDQVVPDLSDPTRVVLWSETERAKRRLLYTLLELALPLDPAGGKRGLRFLLLADERVDTGALEPPEHAAVLTGHERGRLTVNVVEADDAHREAMRKRLNEPYRTMLGHLRHEVGHYYWYRLVEDSPPLLERCRALFGDERADYAAALAAHYQRSAAEGWQGSYVSFYASAHPWEDFAETWAHYIHIVDSLETASDSGIAVGGRGLEPPLPLSDARPFATLLADWLPLSVALNQLNRSMGVRDAYPFALSDVVIAKLGFVHELCLTVARERIVEP